MIADFKQKKIRYVVKSLAVGGTERHLLQLTTELVARGWLVYVTTLTEQNPLQKFFEDAGVSVSALELPKPIQALPLPLRKIFAGVISIIKLRRVLKKDPMPTHFFLPDAYLLGMSAHLLSGLNEKTFMSRRSLNDYQKNIPGARFAEKFFHGRVTAVLGNSRAVVDELLDEGVDSGKTHLIYNGVDSKKIHIEQGTKSLPVQADIFIYCVSNFIQYKGHKDLIDALAQLKREQYPTWHVVCFGRDDGILSSLKSYARKSGVGDRFSWIENQLAPWEFMQKGQIGILPSHQEGFSNALLEMMACELAVIATDVGGNREALESDVGIIVSARNSGEMSGGIRLLLGCAEDRAKYSRRAKLAAQEKFSITAYVDAYEDVYERYLSTTHKTATKP